MSVSEGVVTHTYAEMLRRVAEGAPDAPAVVFPDCEMSYGEMIERASWRARELSSLGVVAGDTFGILLPNGLELVEFLVGGAMLGAAVVPINTRYKSAELQHVVSNARFSAIVTTDAIDEIVDFKDLLYKSLPGLHEATNAFDLGLEWAPHLRGIGLLGDSAEPAMASSSQLRAAAEGQPAPPPDGLADPNDPLVVMYTSGTTAHPKGCVISHHALVDNARSIAHRFRIPPSRDVWWDPLPMFHMGGILLMSAVLSSGGTFVSTRHFDPDEAFDQIETHNVTVLYPLFPTITMTLVHHPRFARADLDRVRAIVNVGPVDMQREVQKAFAPALLVNAYGCTELCGTLTYNELDDPLDVRLATCGRPLDGFEAQIIDPETGDALGPGMRGELIARGSNRFDGYLHDPENTAIAIDADGFFHTGDLCDFDDEGRLSYHGRLKDMLKVGGENVAAVEVESFVSTHPAVKMAQIVGIPDDRLQEVPVVFVELVPGATLEEPELIEFCKGKIASFKVPRHVRLVTEWPMSATKVQKFRLRAQILEELDRGVA